MATVGMLGGVSRHFLTLVAAAASVRCGGGAELATAGQMAMAVGPAVLRRAWSGGGLGVGFVRGDLGSGVVCTVENPGPGACRSRCSQMGGNFKSS